MSDLPKVIFRLGNKPLRFTGQLLGESSICDEDDTGLYTRVRLFKTEGGSYIWAWDLADDEDPSDDELQRADALVINAGKPQQLSNPDDPSAGPLPRSATPAELAQIAWDKRPRENARLTEASTRVFHAAARRDQAIAAALYEEVQ